MAYAAQFAAVLVACCLAAVVLGRARWPSRSPRAAIVCWQAVGLAFGLSAIGLPLAAGLAAYHRPTALALLALAGDIARGQSPPLDASRLAAVGAGLGIAGSLLGTTVSSIVRTTRTRRRHRHVLDLVGRADPAVPGALVLDHPRAAAYCLPGLRPRVVVSAGVLSLLDRAELAAVLSHEQAHAVERHDLVLLPFAAVCRALPGVRWVRAAHDAVGLLIEMRADDRARRQHTDAGLAAALRRFAGAPAVTPPGALGATDHLSARVGRLQATHHRPPRIRATLAVAAAAMLVALPPLLYLS
jgi:Zn-dependent protease with chaperone function